MEQPKRRLSAICFADIVGYTELSNRDEPAALALVQAFQTLTTDIVATYEGRIVKFIGDAVLAEFGSTESAVRAAVAIQERYDAAARELGRSSQLRIGVHLGEVNAAPDGDLYGDGVNMASRLHHEATPGRVIVSEDVWRQLRQRPEFRFAPLGAVELRGITTKVEVFDVLFGARAALASPAGAPAGPAAAGTRGPWIPIGIGAAAVLVAILVFTMSWNAPPGGGPRGPRDVPADAGPAPAETPPAIAAPAPAAPPAAASTAAEPAAGSTAAAAPAASTSAEQPAASTAAGAATAAPPAVPERPAPDGRRRLAEAPGRQGTADGQGPGQELRALIDEFAAALTSGQPRAVAALGPGTGAMSTIGLQQLRQAFGSGLNVRFGRIERLEPTGNGAGRVRFSLVARSDSRADTPLAFEGAVQRVGEELRFTALRREPAGPRGRPGR